MPTGYTADVADGTVTDLPTFAMQLARGMGALVTMRDEPTGTPIPERFEPSDYHAKELARLETERARLLVMTDEQAQGEANDALAVYDVASTRAALEHAHKRQRYQAMIEKVEAWRGAPDGLKEFALQQLRESMDFDCREPFKFYGKPPPRIGREWKTEMLGKVQRDLEYHAAEHAKELQRVHARNLWLAQLRRSLTG
jgi:hypothetical protein